MKPDELDDAADPGRHRRTTAPLLIEDGERSSGLSSKWRRLFRRRAPAAAPLPSGARSAEPPPDDLPENPEDNGKGEA